MFRYLSLIFKITNFVILFLILFNSFVFAAKIKNISDEKAKINIARIIKVINLLDKKENLNSLVVNVVVEDLGGTVDVSETQVVYLTMYSKGEIFSTDIAFKISDAYSFVSAKRIKAGIYQIEVLDENLKSKKLMIDAQKISYDIQNIKGCDDPFCKASVEFSGSIVVN